MAEPKDVVRTWKALAELKNLDGNRIEPLTAGVKHQPRKSVFQDLNMKNKLGWLIRYYFSRGGWDFGYGASARDYRWRVSCRPIRWFLPV